jgi:nucleoid DNA-binding protein
MVDETQTEAPAAPVDAPVDAPIEQPAQAPTVDVSPAEAQHASPEPDAFIDASEAVAAVAEKTGFSQADVQRVFDGYKSVIQEALKRDAGVSFLGVAKLYRKDVKAHTVKAHQWTNPAKGTVHDIPEKTYPAVSYVALSRTKRGIDFVS